MAESHIIYTEKPVKNVWKFNMADEIKTICEIAQTYDHIAVSCKYPGAYPITNPNTVVTKVELHYTRMQVNVNMLKLIQLGLTFFDEEGKTPPGVTTWLFNFAFDVNQDRHVHESIDTLKKSGIIFENHKCHGIDPKLFAEQLNSSGIILMNNIKWLSYNSTYDFGYLLKTLSCQDLPPQPWLFFHRLRFYFNTFYDVKYILRHVKVLSGSLEDVAEQLGINKPGHSNDGAFKVGMIFFEIKKFFLNNYISSRKYSNRIVDLDKGLPITGTPWTNAEEKKLFFEYKKKLRYG